MRTYFLLVVLALFISGCIPKYVDKKPTIKPELKDATELETEAKNIEKIVKPKVIEAQEEIHIEKPREISKSYKVTMKTKKFAFSDTGFLVVSDDMIRLNVLAAGKPILNLRVQKSDDICVDSLCNTKHGFNQSFLVGEYPDDLTANVLQGKPIFGGKNLKNMPKGFIQKIKDKKYDIKYQVSGENIYFKDKQNRIIMKLKELK